MSDDQEYRWFRGYASGIKHTMTGPQAGGTVEEVALEHGALTFTTRGLVCRCGEKFLSVAEYNQHVIRATLTAALPLMEAEIRGQVAAEIRAEFPAYGSDLNADCSTNMVMDAYANGMNDATTIAERTQR